MFLKQKHKEDCVRLLEYTEVIEEKKLGTILHIVHKDPRCTFVQRLFILFEAMMIGFKKGADLALELVVPSMKLSIEECC